MTTQPRPQSVAAELRSLRRRVELLERGPTGQALGVDEPGTFTATSASGVATARLGLLPSDEFGSMLTRASGESALGVMGGSAGVQQEPVLLDRAGNVLVTSASGGAGIGRPYLPLPVMPAPNVQEVAITGATFADAFTFTFMQQHPSIFVSALVRPGDGTTTGQVQLAENNVAIPGTLVTVASFGYCSLGPAVLGAFAGAHLGLRTVTLQAHVTAGAAALYCRVACAYGEGP